MSRRIGEGASLADPDEFAFKPQLKIQILII